MSAEKNKHGRKEERDGKGIKQQQQKTGIEIRPSNLKEKEKGRKTQTEKSE